MQETIEQWLNQVVYFDKREDGESVRRELILDTDRDRVFFFADPLDFDKDDTHKPARYWIDECEGYQSEWHDTICRHFLN